MKEALDDWKRLNVVDMLNSVKKSCGYRQVIDQWLLTTVPEGEKIHLNINELINML